MSSVQYRATPATYADGSVVPAAGDVNGLTLVSGTVTASPPSPGTAGSTLAASLTSPAAKAVPTASSEAITGSPLAPITGVLVQAPITNSMPVYVGAPGVTVSTGIELVPGASLMVRINRTDLVHCISGSAAQTLRVMVV